ncbi:MAG TPA: hypothetical protein VIK89_00540, partial [Cytophagaceae bacterium]
ALGYVVKKLLKIDNGTIARLLIYLIVPVMVFNSAFTAPLTPGLLTLPLLFFLVSSLIAVVFYYTGKKVFKDSTANLLAMASGTANMGYFGLPVIVAILGDKGFDVAIFCVLGPTIFENSLGFYLAARGNFGWKESIYKLLKLPTIYAFVIGILLNFYNIEPSPLYEFYIPLFKGCYIILGMMLVGAGIAAVESYLLDIKYILLSFSAKFIAWPIIILAIILYDQHFFQLFTDFQQKAMLILSLAPMAANNVAFATELGLHPGKAAVAVFLSTMLALLYIPVIVTYIL